MRPIRERLDGAPAPHAAARWLRGSTHAVALAGAWAGGGIVLADDPIRIPEAGVDPFALLDAASDLEAEAPAPGVYGGWLGWLGFGLGRDIEPTIGPPPPRPAVLPAHALAWFDHVVRCDADGNWWFEALWTARRDRALTVARDRWAARLVQDPPGPHPIAADPMRVAGPGAAGHVAAVAACRERIAAGEVLQVNVCLRLETVLRSGAALDLWTAGVGALAPRWAAYVAGPWGAVAGLSPELFLAREGRTVRSAPIKGTRRAAPGAREELVASGKDRAENVMIADLVRNDLGRVCTYGSVTVDALAEPEPAPGVWHLVSHVRGELRDDTTDGDLLRATFPPGSVTGAPKVQALRVAHELEATAREAYCGAMGFVSPVAGMELNVAIRTFETAGDRVWLGAGGGVVWDSDPADELAEALAKAAPLAAAAGLELDAGATVAPPSAMVRPGWALSPDRRRPDPDRGLLETVLVRSGAAVDWEAHRRRLGASARALGLPEPPADLTVRAERAASELGDGRLRVLLGARGLAIEPGGPPARDQGAPVLVPWLLPGGLGAHKWADRRLVDALGADGTVPLLIDLDGHVLEAAYAAVIAVRDGVLVAPPLDGRRLPSVSRARLLATDGRPVRIAPLTLDDLLLADEILLTSALRGPVRAQLRDSDRSRTSTNRV